MNDTFGGRAAVLEAPESIAIRNYPYPTLTRPGAIVRVEGAGICGTDPKMFRGVVGREFPVVLGHEIVGYVADIDEGTGRSWGVAVGDRVAVVPFISCWSCRDCRAGDYKECLAKRTLGVDPCDSGYEFSWGGYADYVSLPEQAIVYPVASEIPIESAVCATGPLANGIEWGVLKPGTRPGDKVLVQGCGPQGLCVLLAALMAGGDVTITGRSVDKARLELARSWGASNVIDVESHDLRATAEVATNGDFYDIVVDATGSRSAVGDSVRLVRSGGTVVLAGVLEGEGSLDLAYNEALFRSIVLRFVRSKNAEAIRRAMDLLPVASKRLETLTTHHFSLDEAATAMRVASGQLPSERNEYIKGVILP